MNVKYIKNPFGPVLGFTEDSQVKILEENGRFFKNLSKSGVLEPYEDWRLTPEERAKDLARRLTIKEIAGLMLFTSHISIPSVGVRAQQYDGQPFEKSGKESFDLTDDQKEYFEKSLIRHSLITKVQSTAVMAKWNNSVQAIAENYGWGIPVMNSSDPRHGINDDTEFNEGSGGNISQWPESLGLAATFDPEVVRKFGEVAAQEYRALGLTLTLSPQADLGTEPRWMRVIGTFGENVQLVRDMTRAYVDGFQTTPSTNDWGTQSVIAMAKHWPGGGSGESGRDGHFGYGKYAIYPGHNFDNHLLPFTDGAFNLENGTKKVGAIMPYYTISFDQDAVNHENVANCYSKYLITDLLRHKYNYDEVVCTDWCITGDEPTSMMSLTSGDHCWGMEDGYTVAERHYKILQAGVDQFGGNKDPEPILEAYQLMVKDYGKEATEKRFRLSAYRILKNMFRVGLFENPYIDPVQSTSEVGKLEFKRAGLDAQIKSIVMLKNKKSTLPLDDSKVKVYIPKRYYPEKTGWYSEKIPGYSDYPLNRTLAARYFTVVGTPEEADVALVKIKSPERDFDGYNGYDSRDVEKGGNGYVPISLQYRPYTAKKAREISIAGDKRDSDVLNRTYKDKTIDTLNESDLDLVIETKKQMGVKPVIVVADAANPFVIAELDPYLDTLMVTFGVSDEAIFEIIVGNAIPSGLLPIQFPKDMEDVEQQMEDVSYDMKCFTDEVGNKYDFGFGLNFDGSIKDERNRRYKKEKGEG
ncbi:glycoside hydrolase family 3 protein [Latilactobacillus curvatus]